MSEGAPFCLNRYDGERKLLSVGNPVPETEVEVVDLETGTRVLPMGEAGEVRVRGPQMMLGYHNKPDETAYALRDGYMYTGDIGYVDEDGFLFLVGRKKEMVIVGGYNVYPREIDEVLFNHPAIREAATVGKRDDRLGEVVVAFVVVKSGAELDEEAFFAYCKENLVKYKRPVEVTFVDALPRTGTNKIDRITLRAMAAAGSELDADHRAGRCADDGGRTILQPSESGLDRSPSDHDQVRIVIHSGLAHRAPHAPSHQANFEVGPRSSLQFSEPLARGVEQEFVHARVALFCPHAIRAGDRMDQLKLQALLLRKFPGPLEYGFAVLIRLYCTQDSLPSVRRMRGHLLRVNTRPYQTVRVMQHLGGDGTQEQRAKRAMAVRRHHDQVDLVLVRVADDLARGIALQQLPNHGNTRKCFGGEMVECGFRRGTASDMQEHHL